MDKKIALVSYYNTEPFLFGLKEKGKDFTLIRSTPAECTALFKSREVDIALVPVVTLFEEKDASIVSNFGICCDNKVKTVVLFTNSPKQEITKIYLDDHSRTSVQLLRVITQNYWKLEPTYIRTKVEDVVLKKGEGVLMIGDKVFGKEDKFKYVYDLGEEWKKFTGLPFVFAVWLKRDHIPSAIVSKLEDIFNYGLQNISTIIENFNGQIDVDLHSYYKDNIHFKLGIEEHQAIERFKKEMQKVRR